MKRFMLAVVAVAGLAFAGSSAQAGYGCGYGGYGYGYGGYGYGYSTPVLYTPSYNFYTPSCYSPIVFPSCYGGHCW